jgi:hypothetical protein
MIDIESKDANPPVGRALFTVRNGDHREQWSYEALFEFGHRLLLKGKFDTAARVFETLAQTEDGTVRAHVFLAFCHTMRNDYAAGSATLHRAFSGSEQSEVAARLHDVFVLWKVGLFLEVKEELMQLSTAHPELPSLSLLLGDLLKSCGAERLSRHFYRRALETDQPHGAVSLCAHSLLKLSPQAVQNRSGN